MRIQKMVYWIYYTKMVLIIKALQNTIMALIICDKLLKYHCVHLVEVMNLLY